MTTNIVLPDETKTLYFIQVTNNKTKKKGYISIANAQAALVVQPQIGADSLSFERPDKARFFINKNLKNTNAEIITNHEYLSKLDITKYDKVDSSNLYSIFFEEGNQKVYIHYSLTMQEYIPEEDVIGACVFTEEEADNFIKETEMITGVILQKELLPKMIEYKPKVFIVEEKA